MTNPHISSISRKIALDCLDAGGRDMPGASAEDRYNRLMGDSRPATPFPPTGLAGGNCGRSENLRSRINGVKLDARV